MNMPNRTRALILLGFAVCAIIILAAGIDGLEFRPGQAFRVESDPVTSPTTAANQPPVPFFSLFRLLLLTTLAALPVIFWRLPPAKRKSVLKAMVLLLILFAMLDQITIYLSGLSHEPDQLPRGTLPHFGLPHGGDLIVRFHPEANPWVTVLISSTIAVLIVWALIAIARRLLPPPTPLADTLQSTFQNTLSALESGADFEDTVRRCYAEMAQILMKSLGIVRSKSWTAREFERHLHLAGMPREPVAQLTRVFEKVRYGNRKPNRLENYTAINALAAIVRACEPPS